ncbi:MAG: UTP--glucose-1-phosphate uridylyltransferase, partial [Myxococcales bacterium]|nr:UTP--glucose-1-phosphate uridylyltransferase [Myxococcales bacterium]
VILAGGMATRFGEVVKAAVPVIDARGFLELKLADAAAVAGRAGARVPALVMTSFATHEEVSRLASALARPEVPVRVFSQAVSVRLTSAGALARDEDGRPSLYAPGHGDMSFALRRTGALAEFLEGGGRTLLMSNVDNLAATLDPAVIGAHLEGGAAVTVEVVDKVPGDRGGAPARVDGALRLVEAFAFPSSFDQDRVPLFNTNTLVFDAARLDRDFELTWYAVRKRAGGREVIQFERLVGELTAHLPSRYLRVERSGPEARFLPVKSPEELARRRGEIAAMLRARGS